MVTLSLFPFKAGETEALGGWGRAGCQAQVCLRQTTCSLAAAVPLDLGCSVCGMQVLQVAVGGLPPWGWQRVAQARPLSTLE